MNIQTDALRRDIQHAIRRLARDWAAYVPARRAATLDPLVALRRD